MTGVIGPCYLYPVGGDSRSAVLAPCGRTRPNGASPSGWPACPKSAGRSWKAGFRAAFCLCGGQARLRLPLRHPASGHPHRQKAPRQAQPHQQICLRNTRCGRWNPSPRPTLTDCLKMNELWHQENEGYEGELTFEEDGEALKKCISHYDQMGLDGLLLRSKGARCWPSPWGSPWGPPTPMTCTSKRPSPKFPGPIPDQPGVCPLGADALSPDPVSEPGG